MKPSQDFDGVSGRRMRLLFLTNLYPPYTLGGLENRCQETADGLAERGHTVQVLASSHGSFPADGEDALPNVQRALHLQADVHHYSLVDFFLKRASQERANREALRRTIAAFQPDLVVVWGMWNLSRNLPHWAETWLPGRVAYVVASYWPKEEDLHLESLRLPGGSRAVSLAKRPFQALGRFVLRLEGYPPALKFEHTVCCSRYVRDDLVEAGALPESAGVLYPGVDPAPFLPGAGPRRRNSGELLRLLYFGNVLPHKGVHVAIQAVGDLKRRGLADQVDLTILGGGHPNYIARLEDLIAQLELRDRVHFVEQVPRSEIPAWLSQHDVYLFTSLWDEPFGRTILEAMLAGLVVIGSTVGGSREIFNGYAEDFMVPPGDAACLADRIAAVLENPDLQSRLVETGRQIALERFTLDRMVDDFEHWLAGIAACQEG